LPAGQKNCFTEIVATRIVLQKQQKKKRGIEISSKIEVSALFLA
jgi:hypothetical protein